MAERRCPSCFATFAPGVVVSSRRVRQGGEKCVTVAAEASGSSHHSACLCVLGVPLEFLLISLCVHLLPTHPCLMAPGTSIFCSVKMTCCPWTTGCSTQRLTPCQSTTRTLKQAYSREAIAQRPASAASAGYCISFPLKEFALFLKWYFGALVQFRTVLYWGDETVT